MATPTLSDYIKRKALEVSHLQTLINHYRELYQFYSDKLPDNKYINYLEENLLTEGFSTVPPATNSFMALRPDQFNFLYPYIRIYKRFNLPGGKTKKIEIPFENKTDLTSFNDPQSYIGEPFDFVSQRFNGPTAVLSGISIEEGGLEGHAVTSRDTDWVRINFDMFFQDPKLLFKNWGTKEFPLRYKDLFAIPGTEGLYNIVLEIGYNVPDGADDDLKLVSQSKLIYELYPDGRPANYDYEETGELSVRFELGGRFERIHDTINLLDQKYYKQLKKANNMIVLGDDEKVSTEEYEKQVQRLVDIRAGIKKEINEQNTSPDKRSQLKNNLTVIKETIRQKRIDIQLAKSAGAVPSSFPFITALYEAGLIYYFELDNDTFKDYITKVAKGRPVDVSDVNYLPKRKPKIRLEPVDFLNKNPQTGEYFSNTLKIKRFNVDEEESNSEKIKYFYFGDLVQVILNNVKGTGVGQDLDKTGDTEFAFLFGQVMWVKDEKTKVVYNILNTPISLDMFLFELNREIYQKNSNFMSLTFFLSTFMKRFFDVTVFSYEKAVAGKQSQRYFGATSYLLDKDKFRSGSKFKKKLWNFAPTANTRETITARLITAMPLEQKINSNIAKKRNIPTFYIGGPDKGPLKKLSFSTSQLPLEAERLFAKAMRTNVDVQGQSINTPGDSSILVAAETRANITLVGNPFFTVGDLVFVDTRFVDGGYFTEQTSNILFTGYFGITSIFHRLSPGQGWQTNIYTEYSNPIDDENPSYNAAVGALPRPQYVDVADGANIGRQEILDTSGGNSTVDKKGTSAGGSTSSAKPAEGTQATPLVVDEK